MFKIGDIVYFENDAINEDNLLVILSVPQRNGKINAVLCSSCTKSEN